MNNKKRAILLLVTISFVISYIQSQVTIGSSNIPLPGTLLYLQEQDYSDGTNARKGLMLPRVKLTDMKNLYPMLGSGYNKTEMDPLHIGLTVYHLEEGVECPTALSGVYTWDGTDWIPLAVADTENDPTKPQSKFTDNEGNTYTYKKFGDKYWMTQNVRSIYQYGNKDNAPLYRVYPGQTYLNEFPAINPGMNRSTTSTTINPLYSNGIPTTPPDPSETAFIPDGTVTYKEEGISITLSNQAFVERFGMIYTYDLATQACPEGWTLPTDIDWLNLVRYVDNDPAATITNSTATSKNTAAAKLKANSYVYTSSDPVDASAPVPQPVSYKWNGCTAKNIGFGSLPSGYAQNRGTRGVYFTERAHYWGTDSNGILTGLYYYIDYKPNIKAVVSGNMSGYYNSVRCVRDTPPN